MSPIIAVEDLVKEFRKTRRISGRFGAVRTLFTRKSDIVRAVDNVGFTIEAGELVGYLGPNGAGKSTTIKMMAGILVPTSGHVLVDGIVPWRERERNALGIGVVFGQRSQLWWDLPLLDSFQLIAKLYRVGPATYRRNLDRMVDLLGMAEFLDRPVRQLSLGQRMRGDLAAAMLYEPAILYLDEPTIGLDVVAKERMRSFIMDMNRDLGTTVILTTHDLADVEELCKRIILIDHGRILHDGGVADLMAMHAPHRTLVVRLADRSAKGTYGSPADLVMPGVSIVDGPPGTVHIRFEATRTPVQELIAAVNAHFPIADLSIVESDLEDVVREIYRGDALL